jgi:two-component SAPR family response regulator
MKAKKHQPEIEVREQRPLPRFGRAVIIDNEGIENQITETMLRACFVAKEISIVSDPIQFINDLHNVERLSEVPELIFVNLDLQALKKVDFIAEFQSMSDFVRSKCKIVVLSNTYNLGEKQKLLKNACVVRYFVKPLDAFQLREFIN